jgi:rod shape determining protein RodA
MIFAVILCRWGFLGGMAVIGLYILWLIGAMATAAICKEAFGRLVVVGIAMMLAVQTAVNMAMVLGFLPIVGLTLPFVSYGGSSMVSVWIMTGLVFSVAMRRPPRMTRPAFEFDD